MSQLQSKLDQMNDAFYSSDLQVFVIAAVVFCFKNNFLALALLYTYPLITVSRLALIKTSKMIWPNASFIIPPSQLR